MGGVTRRPDYGEASPSESPDELQKLSDKGISTLKKASHLDSEIWNNDIDRNRMVKIDDLDLTPDQITLARKAWEIGTEQIVLQIVMQLDGDVTTRISEGFAKNPNPTILKIHNDSIVVSTGF